MDQRYIFRSLLGFSAALLLVGANCSDPEGERGIARNADGELEISDEVIVDQTPVYHPVLGSWPAIALGEMQYLVVWEDHRARRPILYGGRMGLDGARLDPFGFPILDAVPNSEDFGEYEPDVAFDGTNFLVVSEVNRQILGARVSAAGSILDPNGFVIATPTAPASRPSLLFDGEQYLVVWAQGTDPRGPDNAIYRARIKPDATVLDPEGARTYPLALAPKSVGVSFDGRNYLLSWTDYDLESQAAVVRAGRLAPDGTVIDETPIRMSPTDVGVNTDFGPVSAFDGNNHLIAWRSRIKAPDDPEEYATFVSRVTPEGMLVDPDGIVVFFEQNTESRLDRLDIAAHDGHSVVVGSGFDYSEDFRVAETLQVAKIAADGSTSAHPADELASGVEATLTLHSKGGLLLWREGTHTDYAGIIGARLDAAGVPVPDLVTPAATASRQLVKAVGSSEQEFFVVWVGTRGGFERGLYGARLANDGTPLDPEAIVLGTEPADVVEVVFDGANFVVVWAEDVYGSPLYAVRVSPSGERLDPEPLEVPLYAPDGPPAAASDHTHTLLLGTSDSAELAAVLMNQAGAVINEATILEEGWVYEPAAVFDNSGYFVAWHNETNIFGQRISKSGALDGQRFTIATRDFVGPLSLATDGDKNLVVWQEGSGIWAARVSRDGQVLDPEGRLVVELEPECLASECCVDAGLTTGNCPTVAFDEESFVVAWRAPSMADDPSTLNLFGASLDTDAEVLRRFALSTQPSREGVPFLAGQSGRVLAACDQFVPEAPYSTRRAVARLLVR